MKQHDLTPHMVNPEELTLHPENPNHGDKDSIRDSIVTNGFFEPVAVQRSTGYVVHGNHRVKVARDMALDQIPVVYLDLTDTEARTILLAGNATGQKAVMDDIGIGRLLKSIQDDAGTTAGVGYDELEIEDYLLMTAANDDQLARYAQEENTTPAPTGGGGGGGFAPPKATPGIKVPGTEDPDYGAAVQPVPTEDTPEVNEARRILAFDLPLDIYAWISDRLRDLGEEYDLDNKTEVLLTIIAEATGTTAPKFRGPIVSDPDVDGIPTLGT